MQAKFNNHGRLAARAFRHALSVGLVALLPTAILLTLAFQVQADPRAIMGGGNFTNGDTGTISVDQYNALTTLGAKMCRMNLYPNYYWNGSVGTPTTQDSAVLQAHSNGITPMILFEYYASYNDLGGYNKWYAIGRDFAARFKPNSPWLSAQGINGWGITVYSAINEPDIGDQRNFYVSGRCR
jgi:hypothetical protein